MATGWRPGDTRPPEPGIPLQHGVSKIHANPRQKIAAPRSGDKGRGTRVLAGGPRLLHRIAGSPRTNSAYLVSPAHNPSSSLLPSRGYHPNVTQLYRTKAENKLPPHQHTRQLFYTLCWPRSRPPVCYLHFGEHCPVWHLPGVYLDPFLS